MFQICPHYNPEFLIRKPSPLAPLNPNACPRFYHQMTSAGGTSSDTSEYSYKRAAQYPLLQRKPTEEQDRRRQVFLKKVRQVSDDKKWGFRSEQILRKDFLSKQREWELNQERSAPETPQALDDDEREAESDSTEEVKMVDRIFSQENQAFEALILSIQDIADQEDHHQQKTMSDYGSDEEEYDQLFKEVMSRQGSAERSTDTVGVGVPEQHQEMDISLG
ncbi:hypothetical protein HO173_003836 [Letharia columbiana]|uniref:Uncharacterized protein n=1 Tax=Letharia columbiana TaxID=112416 RepID=A0A8H6G0I9_9LECA|nr:uncharacterized protein HO173_003836 [Letharia columbiana]KAF6238202.1 hypothetical protein HO173_003836 [Letharia columbiana]